MRHGTGAPPEDAGLDVAPGGARPVGWEGLEARLASSLASLPVDAYLVLERWVADASNGIRFVQFAREPSALAAEAAGNRYLHGAECLRASQEAALAAMGWDPPRPGSAQDPNWRRRWTGTIPFGEAAELAVRTLRDAYGTPAPADLRYTRFTRQGAGLPDPGLGVEQAAPDAVPEGSRPAAWAPSALDSVIEEGLGTLDGATAGQRICDGEWALALDGVELRICRVDCTPPVVCVYAAVPGGVAHGTGLLGQLNAFNADLVVGRVVWVRGSLVAAVEVPALDLQVPLVRFACINAAGVASRVVAELLVRGRPASPSDGTRRLH